MVSGQHTLPSWYYTSVDAMPKHGTVSSLSHNRWRTQMAFSKSVYSFEVKEDTVPGTVVGKVETVFESPTPITYSVQEDDGENLFLLSPVSGEFLLSRSLDFEAQRFYILTVAVQQGDLQVSSVRVYFSVLNVNDNPPLFSQDTFYASLLEDTRVGSCFLSLNVSDKDDSDNGELKLKLVDGDEGTVFFINSAGSLCLNKELDRERQSSYNLTVAANDCVQPMSSQLTSTAHVIVVVNDVNDNAPLFVSAKSVSIPEDTALHSVVMTVHAEDEDTGPNGEVLYYLNSTSSGAFSIDNRGGDVYLEETLDREQVDTLTITITATDRGSPRMATTMNLTVHVEDANDHDPVFSQSTYSLTVREDIPRGTSLFLVQAHDQDTGPNGRVRYMMTQASPFVVDAVRGVITVMDKLDREKDSNYTLSITVVDQGDIPRSATAAISVTVLDINDFAPQFSPETLIVRVMENEEDPSQLKHQLSALDEDLGVNSQLTYFIQKGNSDGLFSITPNGTFQILHSLDREKESLYIVMVIAVDSGLPPLTGTLTVHVMVDDINDNHPEFTEEVYNTIVSEDTPTGTVFAMITASDSDEGVSGELRYFMENPDVPFAIEETSGELFTTEVLDRETVAIYRLTVIGSDKHPTQPLSSSVIVTVLIGDINDHWPQFMNSPYVAYVPTEMAPDECLKVRCQNGGTCIPTQDGYYCHCVPGFEGEKCEQFIDHCRSTPCVQGSCINSQTGFSCHCPFGVSGVHCEEHSYGFEELSFMEFPSLDRRTNLISLEFATVQRNSMLLYNPGGSSSREFLALEILNGAVHLSYDLGSGPVRLQTNKQVADGYFHSITARRIGNMGSLHVDNCTDVENNGFCFSQSDGSSSERTLDIGNSNMTFGGLRTAEFILLHPAQIKTHDFVGCVRNFHVNGILLRPSMALATYNILDRCPRTTVSPCHGNPCKNGGVCHDLWSDYLCECKSPFIGSNCAKETSEEVVLQFNGNDYIEYVIKESFKRDYLLKDLLDDEKEENNKDQTMINIKFKTKDNGVLMFLTGQTGYFVLKIKDRKPVYLSKDTLSGHLSEFTVDSPVADGVWHVLSLFSNGHVTFLALDGKPVLNITDRSMDLTPVSVEKIVLGAALTGDSKVQQSGFTGCMQYFNVTGYTLPVSGHSVTVDIWPSWTLIQSSCISPGVCLPSPCSEIDTARRGCLSGQCQNRW
ncbi:protocadherin Fat 4-like isoform X1, partial [Lates japonicus]